jgi:hypothetical protein
MLPARSPNLNAYAERWVRSVKEECLSKASISTLSEITKGRAMPLLFPRDTHICREGPVQSRERLGGLLRFYHREAA